MCILKGEVDEVMRSNAFYEGAVWPRKEGSKTARIVSKRLWYVILI